MKFSSFIVEMDNMPPSEPQEVDKPVPANKFNLDPDPDLNKRKNKPRAHNIRTQRPDGVTEIKQNRGHPEFKPGQGFGTSKNNDLGQTYEPYSSWNFESQAEDVHKLNELRKNDREKYDADPMNKYSHEILGNLFRSKTSYSLGDTGTNPFENDEDIIEHTPNLPDDWKLKTDAETHGLPMPDSFPPGWDEGLSDEESTAEEERLIKLSDEWAQKNVIPRTDDDLYLEQGINDIHDYQEYESGFINMFLRYGGYDDLDSNKKNPSWQRLAHNFGTSGTQSELEQMWRGKKLDEDGLKTKIDRMSNAMKHQEEMFNEEPKFYTRYLEDKAGIFESLKEGDVISDPGFMSTASNEVRPDWKWPGNTKMDIYAGKGRYRLPNWIGKYKEGEVLFEPGTRLMYKGRGDDGQFMFDQEGFERPDTPPAAPDQLGESVDAGHGRGDVHLIINRAPHKNFSKFASQLDHDD